MNATSANKTTGGKAAKTISTHNPVNSVIEGNTATIKEAAAKFDCAASSLKNNIKLSKLPAIQANPKAPYLVDFAVVERFLRDTPGIASCFHSRNTSDAVANENQILRVPAMDPRTADAGPVEAEKPTELTDRNPAPEHVAHRIEACPSSDIEDVSSASGMNPERGAKRRRRRRRGKGLGVEKTVMPAMQTVVLKTLIGCSPQERLRITACLNELAGLVASA